MHEKEQELRTGTGGCRMCLAIPGKIIEVSAGERSTALIDVVGVRRRVDLGLLQDDAPIAGDWVLIHVGFAMSKISEAEALDQMHTFSLLGEAEAALEEVTGYSDDDARESGQAEPKSHAAGL
jgi:hydrogenase expression/formation protein HypC